MILTLIMVLVFVSGIMLGFMLGFAKSRHIVKTTVNRKYNDKTRIY